ncbi:MAG TPA: lysophospholipid acyltransferase family protein [Bryobacteraceae bacterium]|nr:lysophospholipid acyltransferase family protein [Bryobacteraceae bacterium]
MTSFELKARAFATALDWGVPRLRRVALRNLELAGFGDVSERIADGVFLSIGRIMASVAAFPSITRANVHEWIRYHGLENFTAAQAKGRGVLVATAHLGNWELSAFTHALMTAPMHIVVRPLDNPRLDAWVERRRTLSGNHVIRKKEAAREILRALSAGDAVGILMDQNTTPAEGVFVDFFGRKACAGTAFVKFAHHTGAAVVPGYALWSESEKRYILRFDPEITMTGDVQADTQSVHSELERVIRAHPDQWLWVHRRWKTRPPGEASLY